MKLDNRPHGPHGPARGGAGRSLARVTSVDDLLAFVRAAPSPYHVVAEASRRLAGAGFDRLDLSEPWPDGAGRYFVSRGGA
ncbi:MAG: hypothetical protein H0U29_08565, partial [Acidimicrobiia bacterium]|nr:hypothetical protein [Acidimicrobiia bacterium]